MICQIIMTQQHNPTAILDFLRSSWFLIMFIGGLVYWAAKQDSSLAYVQRDEARINELEKRANMMETGIGQLQTKMDGIKEDITLIKRAVIK